MTLARPRAEVVNRLADAAEHMLRARHDRAHNGDIFAGGPYDECPLCTQTRDLIATVRADAVAKPDGWHTYHVCGGELREIRQLDGRELYCVHCNAGFFPFTVAGADGGSGAMAFVVVHAEVVSALERAVDALGDIHAHRGYVDGCMECERLHQLRIVVDRQRGLRG